ncbi:C1 family peptidase (plasmid) [Microvirga sp. VF16]|nr:C1 family peptidase [Microvirga sp. VF16]
MAAAANETGGDAANRILNCEPSQEVERDWRTDAALDAGILRAAYVPDEVDLREQWWQIGDQGRTGSCVGWATADSVLRWHFVRNGRIAQNVLLSTRFVWVAAKETDEFSTRPTTFIEEAGTSLKSALEVARKLGAVTADVLPFDREQLFQGQEASFYTRAAQLKIASYINLGTDLSNWRLWLYQNGPILTRLVVDQNFMRAADLNGLLSEYDEASAAGGHAVALVGYTKDGFIVRNSWSPSWGRQGFALATNSYAQRAFTEAYGVNV